MLGVRGGRDGNVIDVGIDVHLCVSGLEPVEGFDAVEFEQRDGEASARDHPSVGFQWVRNFPPLGDVPRTTVPFQRGPSDAPRKAEAGTGCFQFFVVEVLV